MPLELTVVHLPEAACRGVGPSLFFPDRGGDHAVAAKAICAGCPVRVECLEAALVNDEKFGIWGGKSERERRQIRARRDRVSRSAA